MDWFQLIHPSVHPSAHAGGGGSIPAGRVFASRHRGSVLLIFRSYMRAQPGNRLPFCFLAKGPATAPFRCLGVFPHPKWGDPLVCYDGELLGRRVPPWPAIYQGSNSPVVPIIEGGTRPSAPYDGCWLCPLFILAASTCREWGLAYPSCKVYGFPASLDAWWSKLASTQGLAPGQAQRSPDFPSQRGLRQN